METGTVSIYYSEYAHLIRDHERIMALERLGKVKGYLSTEEIEAILDIQIRRSVAADGSI